MKLYKNRFDYLDVESAIQELLEVDAVKAVKRHSGPVLKIELFSREIPGSEAVEIRGDMRKITPKVKSVLDEARNNGQIDSWQWIVRPEKKYQETSLGRSKVSDRKAKGHKPGYYRVSIEEK